MAKRIERPTGAESHASVRQISRNRWIINIYDPMNYCSDYASARTEAGAYRKAERMLVKHNRKYGKLSAGFIVQ